MCIQWCCKDCIDKITTLTHRWARERCNEYFITRSQNPNTTACPNGPWQLRRAYHRHPYRGPQMCDDCKKAGRKEKKLIQSARQRANVALGQPPEYNEVMSLAELKNPGIYHRNMQLFLGPGKLDEMKAKWETFSAANGHLPSHELEREWAKRFAASNDVELKAGVCPEPLKFLSTVGQKLNEEVSGRASAAVAREVFRNPHQQIHRHFTSSTYERMETPSQSPHLFIRYNHDLAIKRPNTTQEASSIANQRVHYEYDISSATDTEKHNVVSVGEASYPTTCQPQLPYKLCSSRGDKGIRSNTFGEREAPRDPSCGEVRCNSISATRSSSSQPTRTRPWDL